MNTGKYAHDMLRFGVASLFLWFGMSQLMSPQEWVSFVPEWLISFPLPVPITPEQIVLFNGGFETLFGSLVALGFIVRFSALLLSLNLLAILSAVGYTSDTIRDLAFAICTLSLAFFRQQSEIVGSRAAPATPKPLF